jgi:hypothetical protein
MENTNYKRTSKSPSPETRQKISQSLKGRMKSDITKSKISDSLKQYWNNPSNFPDDGTNKIETGEIV